MDKSLYFFKKSSINYSQVLSFCLYFPRLLWKHPLAIDQHLSLSFPVAVVVENGGVQRNPADESNEKRGPASRTSRTTNALHREDNREDWGLWHAGQTMTISREQLPNSISLRDWGPKHQDLHFLNRARIIQLIACNILIFKCWHLTFWKAEHDASWS